MVHAAGAEAGAGLAQGTMPTNAPSGGHAGRRSECDLEDVLLEYETFRKDAKRPLSTASTDPDTVVPNALFV